jgi:hypothetical protein
MRRSAALTLAMGVMLGGAGSVPAGSTIHVDITLSADCLGKYQAETRACGEGSGTAYRSLSEAARIAGPGDTVLLRGGTYGEPLAPASSGTEGQVITFRGHPGEEAIITGATLKPAIDISNRRHLVIERLRVQDVDRWLAAVDAHHNVIRRNIFLRSRSEGGGAKVGLYFMDATYNRIVENHLEDTLQDNLALVRSERNVVEGNIFRRGLHSLWAIRCASFNVIRGNQFHNDLEKIGEVFDCATRHLQLFDATRRNLIENNAFVYVPPRADKQQFSGIQYAGQQGIIRFNRFHDLEGPGLAMAVYGKEARHNTGNRVYHNVFHGTKFTGVAIANGATFNTNAFKNNTLSGNRLVTHGGRWPWYLQLHNRPVQLMTSRLDGFLFEGNGFWGGSKETPYLIVYGERQRRRGHMQGSLSSWESSHPKRFRGNIEAAPEYLDEAARDFRLRPASSMVDAGVFLTRTLEAGTGTRMPVEDAGYFFDGYGIPGEKADLIQLENETRAVRIERVDYENHVLVLSESIAWAAGQGVHLPYAGRRPDIGAYESWDLR